MKEQEISVERLKSGDEKVFRSLFDAYYPALCLFAAHYLKDDSEAADIVQNCFIKYWECRSGFDSLSKIRSFLYTVVHNACLNILRDEKRRQESLGQIPDSLDFHDLVIKEEALRMFYSAVEQLPTQSKRVIQLALDGKRNEEIADELGISKNTVHMLKKIAYRKLKEMLREYYYLVFLLLD